MWNPELRLLDRANRDASVEDAQRWFIDRTSLDFAELRQLILNEIDFIVIGKGSKGYGGRTHAAVRQEKIWARAEVFWKAPHYTWNGISTEELLDMPIQLTGTLGEAAPTSATVPSEPAEEWTREAVSARQAAEGMHVQRAPDQPDIADEGAFGNASAARSIQPRYRENELPHPGSGLSRLIIQSASRLDI